MTDHTTQQPSAEPTAYVVTVRNHDGRTLRYITEAGSEDDAKARGYRLHCASDAYNSSKRSEVVGVVPLA